MLNALRPRDPRYRCHSLAASAQEADLAFVVSCWGVLDPLRRYHMALEQQRQPLLDGHHAYWAAEAQMEEGSPQRILERGEAVQLPPVLALQGDADANLGPDMAEQFGAAYALRGGDAEIITYPGAPHGFLRKEPDSAASRHANERIVAFMLRHGTV